MEKKADPFGNTKRMILNLLLDGSKTAGEIADKLRCQNSFRVAPSTTSS
jgi:hypothetical protein